MIISEVENFLMKEDVTLHTWACPWNSRISRQ